MLDTSADRLGNLQKAMLLAKQDMVALSPGDNLRYLLGYSPVADERPCFLLVSRNSAGYVIPELNAAQAKAHTSIPVFAWTDAAGPAATVIAAIGLTFGSQPTAVLVDNSMPASFLLLLQSILPGSSFDLAGNLMSSLRQTKTSAELDSLRAAAKMADRAVGAVVEACCPGVTEKYLARAAIDSFLEQGAEEVSFVIIASGPNSSLPHHEPTDRVVAEGDTVVVDIGCRFEGYQSDITRTVHLGEPDAEWFKVYEAAVQANEAAASAIRPGITCGEIDAAARSVIEREGYGEYFVHRTGHGIGLSVHEPPWIAGGSDAVLQEGMVFSIEPGIYLPGRFGIRVEDIAVVTASGYELVTGLGHEPVIITAD